MKLEHLLLVENNLAQFRNAPFNANVLGQRSGATDLQVQEIKQALKRHRLALGERPEGSLWNSDQMAWTGDESGVWTAELSRAIRTWKESIQKQTRGVARAKKISVNDTINNDEDLFYLIDAELIPEGQSGFGFLKITQGRVASEIKAMSARIDWADEIPVKNVDSINSLADMIDGIGYNGWIAIITPILNTRFPPPRDNARVGRERDALIQQINTTTGGLRQWYTNFRRKVLRGVPESFSVEINGSKIKLLPDAYMIVRSFPHKLMFLHFANIASALLKQGAATDAERETAAAQEDADRYANQPTSTDIEYEGLARALKAAFENDLLAAVLPGGRGYESDDEVIEDVFSRIKSAADYDKIAQAYATPQIAGDNANLGKDLSEQMRLEDYERIVKIRLSYVRRIAPKILHARINFAGAENITVNLDNKDYVIGDRVFNDKVQIEPEVFDVILEDAILRQAIEQSGNTIPDLFVEPKDVPDEIKLRVANLFIEAIESTYPELVPWYTNQEPFDSVSLDLGGARLREIMAELAVLANAGSSDSEMTQRIVDILESDRLWLVGDGTEDNRGNAAITFDRRYQLEGLGGRTLPASDLQTNLNDTDRDLITRMADDRKDIVAAAMEELAAKPNSKEYYKDKIYNGFRMEEGKYPDLFYNGEEALKSLLMQGTFPDNDAPFAMLIRALDDDVAIAAPSVIVDLIEESFEGENWLERRITGGTNEELLLALVSTIKDRATYNWVNTFYNGNLFNDVRQEGRWSSDFVKTLADAIGADYARAQEFSVPEAANNAYIELRNTLAGNDLSTMDQNELQPKFDAFYRAFDAWGESKMDPAPGEEGGNQIANMTNYWAEVLLPFLEVILDAFPNIDDMDELPEPYRELADYIYEWRRDVLDLGDWGAR